VRFAWPGRILEKVLDIVAPPTERISRAMPKHDTRVRVVRRLVEDAGESQIHRRCHRVPAWSGDLNCTSRTLPVCSVTISSMVEFRLPLVNFTVEVRGGSAAPAGRRARPHVSLGFGTAPLARKPSISVALNSELPENLVVVFSNLWGALRRHLGDAHVPEAGWRWWMSTCRRHQ